MLREEITLRILDRASSFISDDHLRRLRNIIDEELYHYAITPTSQELVPVNDMASWIQLFISCKKLDGLSRKTLKNYARELMKFAFVTQKNLEQIDDMDIRMYLSRKSQSGCKNNTLNTLRSAMMSFFGWMVEMNHIQRNPVQKIKPIKTEKFIRQALTREEMEMLRDACKTLRERAVVEFFYSTGCRLDEIQKLSLSKIDWQNKSMIVFGKGSKEREVYFNDKALHHLKKYIEARADNDDAIFVRERAPHTRLCARMIQEIFAGLGRRAGIKHPVYPHLLRHTFATHMLDAGTELQYLQDLMGHSSPATTQIYARLSRRKIQEVHRTNMAG
jgi:integrase/recombinase XerD